MGRGILVSVDGPSKVGSTSFVNEVAAGTEYQQKPRHTVVNELLEQYAPGSPGRESFESIKENLLFHDVARQSAGNYFRALALAQIISELNGQPVCEVRPESGEDRDVLLEFMAIDGIERVLQDDPNIGSRVSTVSKLPGVADLCENAFCAAVSEAYHRGGKNNLVIADARNPLLIFERRDLIGTGRRQIAPESIVPVYLDAPAEDAAHWLPGDDHAAKVAQIKARREGDANRPIYPVVVPDNLTTDLQGWVRQFYPPRDSLVEQTYHLQNGRGVTEDQIRRLGDITAAVAWDLLGSLNARAAT